MATVSFIPESNQSISAMKGVIAYCLQQKKVADEGSGRRLVGGVNCNGENAFMEFMTTKTAHEKTGGMTFYHYVQSFSPTEKVTAEQVHRIGLELAAKAWASHEVLVTTHTDAEHLHNHFVINSVHYENGKKLRQNPGTLTKLRMLSDAICTEYGLSVLRPYEKDGAKISSREYRAAAKGESWKFQLIADMDFVMNRSGSRDDFVREMNRLGYQITWTDERKYITFTCPNGMKCRDIRLHDKKYLKGTLLRVSMKTVYKLIKEKSLPAVKVGRENRIAKSQLIDYLLQKGSSGSNPRVYFVEKTSDNVWTFKPSCDIVRVGKTKKGVI